MQTESRSFSALVDRLKAEHRVWLRLAACRPQEDWQLSLLEVTIGEAPPSWSSRNWRYERAVFVASRLAGATVARWLERNRISRNSLSVPFDPGESV